MHHPSYAINNFELKLILFLFFIIIQGVGCIENMHFCLWYVVCVHRHLPPTTKKLIVGFNDYLHMTISPSSSYFIFASI